MKTTEMVTLPSGASYPASLEPLTANERALLDKYELIRHYEKEAARLKAEEARRRLEEADERYLAKVRERERAEGKKASAAAGDDESDGNVVGGGEGDKKKRGAASGGDGGTGSSPPHVASDGDDELDDDGDEAATARRKKRAEEISRLRKDVDEARDAREREEARRKGAREREESMRRALLGEEDDDGAAAAADGRKFSTNEGGGRRKRPADSDGGERQPDDDGGDDEGDVEDEAGRSKQQRYNSEVAIKKKRRTDASGNPLDGGAGAAAANASKPSLLANMDGGATPVHDFSRKLGMSKADGSVLFPFDGDMRPWEPPEYPNDFIDGCLELDLPDFDPRASSSSGAGPGNNTLAIKFAAGGESKRFSVNVAAERNDGYNDVLFHFNPRHFKKGGQLVLNDRRESMWGNDISVPLSTLPLMFGVESCTLVVQINEEGFDVFVEGVHCARLEHRTPLSEITGGGGGGMSGGMGASGEGTSLRLQFPSSDDYGNPEDWRVYRVWWGRKPSMVKESELDGVAGVNRYSAVHPKKLFVSRLTKLFTDPEVDLRRAELERAFRKYGGPNGVVAVSVQKGSTFAFVELASEAQADLALVEMADKYRLNKARRTKHEALLEERAAKEAMEKGTSKENGVDWD